MKRIVILIVVAAMALGGLAVYAQEPTTGSGGPIVEGNFAGSVNFGKLNPNLTNDTATLTITNLMFPGLIGVSPYTQTYALVGDDGVYGALATSYDVSDDGLTYTFHLRNDATWPTDHSPGREIQL
jgi:peptide/nickel transport system substrate-binding protein